MPTEVIETCWSEVREGGGKAWESVYTVLARSLLSR